MHDTQSISTKAFKTYKNDPIAVKEYTLQNGLKLLLSVNTDEPRIYTEIAVRVGSKHDPADTTGLAHYFEHMMFKGTDRLGSLDWEKEKPLLDQIEVLFEQHRACNDPAEKKRLYAEIDRLSFEAARFAAANEYDKLVSAIGAKDTNAYTWVEQTVYVNDIPTNELERWFLLEAERFRRPVLRLFHTELETVFEEYNISQDKDFRKSLKAMQAILTPSHPYGTQTTLGRGEDLKNPSQTNIYHFFDQYYVPNNMAIVLCGDFDPEQVVELAERYFGSFKAKPIPPFTFEPQPELQQRTLVEVHGNEAPWVEMAWRMPSASSPELDLLPIVSALLYNGEAGLIDEHLIQQQHLLEAYAYPRSYADYGSLYLYGKPREGQTHAEVEALLWSQIERLRNGDFADWLIEAVVKNLKLHEARHFEKNEGRAGALSAAYILGLEWGDMIQRWKKWESITKEEVVDFAQRLLHAQNYGVVYKHCASDPSVMKVEKPPITPVELNRADTSEFGSAFLARTTPDIDPHFLDFKKVIKSAELATKVTLRAVPQAKRPTFRLDYCFDMGKLSDRRLAVLEAYLPFLGTSNRTATALRQQFFRLGLQFFATCREEHFYLSLSGLPESLQPGLALMEEVLATAQPDQLALQNLVNDLLLKRDNDKKEKRSVLFKAMFNQARYGEASPFRFRFSKEELLDLKAEGLTALLADLRGIQHEVYYTGPHAITEVKKVLKEQHVVLENIQSPTAAQKFKEKSTTKHEVLFVDFPTVQVELLLYSKGTGRFNLEEYLFSQWYNQYFGYGLSSIVYQDIREARALAYSAYCYAANPSHKNRSHYLQAYVGTQPDKLKEAVEAFQSILEEMPVSPTQLAHARTSVLKQLAADRIAPAEIYWTWRSNRDKGVKEDLRKRVFQFLQDAQPEALIQYQKQYIKGRKFTWLVLGDRSRVDFEYLRTIGKVTEMTVDQVFGY